jgi:hypothetical protein
MVSSVAFLTRFLARFLPGPQKTAVRPKLFPTRDNGAREKNNNENNQTDPPGSRQGSFGPDFRHSEKHTDKLTRRLNSPA